MRLVPNSHLLDPILHGLERIQRCVDRWVVTLVGALVTARKTGRDRHVEPDFVRATKPANHHPKKVMLGDESAAASQPAELVNLPAIAEQIAAHLEREAASRMIQVEIDLAPDALVMSDYEGVHDIIHALFSEALKRTPTGGSLTLSGSVRGGSVLLQFASNGSGTHEASLDLRLPISPPIAEGSALSLESV
jgi:signal transduction histidine kinase